MNYKKRLLAMQEFMAQAGKRLSKSSEDAIKAAIVTLEALVGTDDADETAVEQAFDSVQKPLVQAMVTGISVNDTFEVTIERVSRALHMASNMPGMSRWSVFTHPDGWVAFRATEDWDNWTSHIADYADDGTTITFSNVRECSIEQIIVEIEQADTSSIEQSRKQKIEALSQQTNLPALRMLDGSNGPLLLQTMPGTVTFQKKSDGRYVIQGIATHGNVPNLNNPPIVFPTELWAGQMVAMQELIAQGKAVGCLGHPSTQEGDYRMPEPDEYAIKFTKLEQNGDFFPIEAITCSGAKGKELAALMDDGIMFDLSTVSFGKTKKQDFNGQAVNVVQPEGFAWVRIADVVLQGASPGAEITDIRLQAMNMGPTKEDAKMTPEEIKAMIAQAIKDHDSEAVKLLQAKLDDLEQKPALSDDDKTVLAEARQMVAQGRADMAVQSRDKKVEEVVDKLIADKELPAMFRSQAITIGTTMNQSADTVDGNLPQLKIALKPFLEHQALLQSKGIMVPEYKGESKIVVNTPEEAIEDLVQTAIKKGKIVDTGEKLPSNQAFNARTMLQTLALEKPGYAVAHMKVRNGDAGSFSDMKNFLQQNYTHLVQDVSTGTVVDDVAAAIPFVLPIVMEMMPQLFAGRYCSFQPMSKSAGTIAYWKTEYANSGTSNRTAAAFHGSYADGIAENTQINKLKGGLTTETINPVAKKLGFDLSVEVIRRLRTDWGIDATVVMIAECAAEIAREWNYKHFKAMLTGATGGNWTYGVVPPTDDRWTGKEWQEQFMTYLTFAEAGIGDKCQASVKAIVGSRSRIARAVILARGAGMLRDTGTGQGSIARGVNIAGTMSTGEDLVSVDWWNEIVSTDKLLLVAQGEEWYRSGYVVAPYLGLYISPGAINNGTLNFEQGMMSEVAEKMINGNFFGTITVDDDGVGIPL